MGFTKVTPEELHQIATQLISSASTIDGENSRSMAMVNGLVGGGWEGAASAQFEGLFAEWKSGADHTHHALTQISALLNNAGTLYADTESQIQQAMAQ